MYEGVVFPADGASARAALSEITSPLRLRLVRLSASVFGIYRVAGRADALDRFHVEQVAAHLSSRVGMSGAFFYDNRCGVSISVLYCAGERLLELGDADEWWVSLSEVGEPILDSPRLRSKELRSTDEYECVYSAIDAGLEVLQVRSTVSGETLKKAFCYDELAVIAQSNPGFHDA
jgi:hypothetical protein